MIERVETLGKPFISNHHGTLGKQWMIRIRGEQSLNEFGRRAAFVGSIIGVHPRMHQRGYPYNLKLWNYLNNLRNYPIDFAAFLDNVQVTDEYQENIEHEIGKYLAMSSRRIHAQCK